MEPRRWFSYFLIFLVQNILTREILFLACCGSISLCFFFSKNKKFFFTFFLLLPSSQTQHSPHRFHIQFFRFIFSHIHFLKIINISAQLVWRRKKVEGSRRFIAEAISSLSLDYSLEKHVGAGRNSSNEYGKKKTKLHAEFKYPKEVEKRFSR